MNTSKLIRLAIIALVAGCFAQQASAFTKPTNAELDDMLANPNTIKEVLNGATANEAADVVLRSIDKINAANMSAAEKKQSIALLVAYAVAAMGPDAPAMVAAVAKIVGRDTLPIVVAAAVTASTAPAATLAAVVAALGPDSAAADVARDAAASPSTALGGGLVNLLLTTLRPVVHTGQNVVPLLPVKPQPTTQVTPPIVKPPVVKPPVDEPQVDKPQVVPPKYRDQ